MIPTGAASNGGFTPQRYYRVGERGTATPGYYDAVLDVETVGMEYSVILKSIRQAAELLEAGTAREVAIKAERMITVIRLLNDEYFVAITLKPSGNLGKARFLLRTRSQKLLSDLV